MENIAATICEAGAVRDLMNSLNAILCSDEEPEADNYFMAQLFGDSLFPDEVPLASNFSSAVWLQQLHDPNSGFLGADHCSFSYPFMQGCSFSSNEPTSFSHQFVVSDDELMKLDNCPMMDGKNIMEGGELLNQDNVSNDCKMGNVNKGKLPMSMPELLEEDKVDDYPSESNKRHRIHGEVQRGNRSAKLRKCCYKNGEDNDSNTEYVSNDLHEHTQVSSSTNGKTRASRGSATDPQSLYARKRRERINERLKILQKLVPNGTKVDISTMLEEAVQYVKFLQLQIKMLSSDELWMYAPIAYNGLGIGLDLKIPTPNPQC